MGQAAYGAAIRHLSALGFSELEAMVYSYLVENSPATGYRTASAIGKPVANTYKALESLRDKGAVVVDVSGESRICSAVPPGELLDRLRKDFDEQHAAAEKALTSLRAAEQLGGIFELTSVEQIFHRCERMLASARDVVLVDAFPLALDRIAASLEAAAGRRVAVAVQLYREVFFERVTAVLPIDASRVLKRWPGQWLCLVVDGAEYLFAYLDDEGGEVKQAVWSDSPFLAWVHHSYLGSTLRDHQLERIIREGANPAALRKALAAARKWSALDSRGYASLRARFGE